MAVLIRALRRRAVLDIPNDRSSHERPVPRGLGAALATACLLGAALSAGLGGDERAALLIGGATLALLGFAEDVRAIAPAWRFAIQVAVSCTAVGVLFSSLSVPLAAKVALAVPSGLWVVGFVNAFNFMDGIDGISIAQVVVSGSALAIIGSVRGAEPLVIGGILAIAAIVPFMSINLPRARGFMGDSGSYFFGGWLAILALVGLSHHAPIEAIGATFAIYVADSGTTLLRRVRAGEDWWAPHRTHAYQRLISTGWSHIKTSTFVAAMCAVAGAFGLLSLSGSFALRAIGDLGIVLVVGLYLAAPRLAETNQNRGAAIRTP